MKSDRGVTFADFKGFYNVLFGGSDLERAMFFLDTEKSGINRYVMFLKMPNLEPWVRF